MQKQPHKQPLERDRQTRARRMRNAPSSSREEPRQAKRRRYKPGTVALREIRFYQKTCKLIIPAAPFIRTSRYDSRSADPGSYRDRRTDSGFGGVSSYGGARSSSSKKDYDGAESPRKLDLDGLTPFEKNFYTESPAVAAMSESEAEEYRHRREITVEGRDVPKPVKAFRDVGFPEYIIQEIVKAGFTEPTPIQAQGWPMALKGRDLVGLADTGSGKTLAYLLSAIVHVNAQLIERIWFREERGSPCEERERPFIRQ
ncbi:unnamed protein product [Camellia sinensis]